MIQNNIRSCKNAKKIYLFKNYKINFSQFDNNNFMSKNPNIQNKYVKAKFHFKLTHSMKIKIFERNSEMVETGCCLHLILVNLLVFVYIFPNLFIFLVYQISS